MLDNRGSIQFRKRAQQLRDFSGLRFGNITPTDADGIIEYKDKGWVVIEAKFGDAQMPRGQELALERLCDDLQKVKPTLLIVAKHNYPPEQDIDLAKCKVERYRYKGKWRTPNIIAIVKDLIDSFLVKFESVKP